MESRASSVGNREEAKILLPDIKMRPKEMLIIHRLLSRCDPLARIVFITLMENWARAGFQVATTPGTIALDASCGAKRDHIAALINPSYGRPAAICLCWEILRKQKQFPCDALDAYQNTVRRIAPLHVTPS
jgi:hypothetical protein